MPRRPPPGTRHRGRKDTGAPADSDQINFTDPDSSIMPALGGKAFEQSYNCQTVVDSEYQVIVATRATNETTDVHQAASMIREAIENIGATPEEMSADAGYYSAQSVREVESLGVEAFIVPDRTRHNRKAPPAPRGRISAGLSPPDRMSRHTARTASKRAAACLSRPGRRGRLRPRPSIHVREVGIRDHITQSAIMMRLAA